MDAAVALGILFAVFSLDIGATERVVRSNVYTTPQKALQIAVVWVIPFIGAVVALALAEACSRTPPPNMTSDLRKSSRTYCHTYCHPDGIRVVIEFLFERSYDVPTNWLLDGWFSFDRIAEHIAISNPKTVEVLLKQHIHGQPGSRVQHMLNILSQSCGQLVTIVRFGRFDPRLPPDPKAPAIAMALRRA
jgi:hypothetical protein